MRQIIFNFKLENSQQQQQHQQTSSLVPVEPMTSLSTLFTELSCVRRFHARMKLSNRERELAEFIVQHRADAKQWLLQLTDDDKSETLVLRNFHYLILDQSWSMYYMYTLIAYVHHPVVLFLLNNRRRLGPAAERTHVNENERNEINFE